MSCASNHVAEKYEFVFHILRRHITYLRFSQQCRNVCELFDFDLVKVILPDSLKDKKQIEEKLRLFRTSEAHPILLMPSNPAAEGFEELSIPEATVPAASSAYPRLRPEPEEEASSLNIWQNFGKISLVFGCIGADFCNEIRVLQHFSKSTRLSS